MSLNIKIINQSYNSSLPKAQIPVLFVLNSKDPLEGCTVNVVESESDTSGS